MSFGFGFGEFNARADLPNVPMRGVYKLNESQREQIREFYQALRPSELEEEARQLLVGALEGCEAEYFSDIICHTSDNGGTCSEPCGSFKHSHFCLQFWGSQNCTRDCSASVRVYCDLSFPPRSNPLPAVNETGQHSLDSK